MKRIMYHYLSFLTLKSFFSCALSRAQSPSGPVSVRDYGAIGDDKTHDTNAFVAALRARRNVYVPEGVYRIGTVQLPDQTYLHGDGRASVIRFVPGKDGKAAIHVGTSCRVSNLRFTGTEPFDDWITGKGSMEPVMLRAQGQRDIEIDRIQIDDFRHNGIWLDDCKDVRIENCVRGCSLSLAIHSRHRCRGLF